ncbi:unnamed protein product [Ranitomeya imitator]|uniref:Immunoglobulin C1-set domain-containing protein n=1 Tax=Ranitomeya imitator TaxID=111125 RepID=A0ABN9LUP9_9NEOB|nr:unnamed protein product [Ranitomeya imitator]
MKGVDSGAAAGYVMQEISLCSYGDDEKGNATFQYVFAFNHQYILGYNSKDNMFLPYNSIEQMMAVVRKFTTEFNTNPDMLNYVKNEEKRCKKRKEDVLEGDMKPSMEVFVPDENKDNLPLLICFVWGFYPEKIIVSWIKNNKTVVKTEDQAVQTGGNGPTSWCPSWI